MWRNANRPGTSSENNRQLAHKSFTTSSRPDSSRPLAPETNSNSRAILPSSSSSHNRNSLSRANGSWVTFSTPSTSSQLTSRGPPIQPRRTNPTTPSWKPGQSQPQRAINAVIIVCPASRTALTSVSSSRPPNATSIMHCYAAQVRTLSRRIVYRFAQSNFYKDAKQALQPRCGTQRMSHRVWTWLV